jgi:hypothetical protein
MVVDRVCAPTAESIRYAMRPIAAFAAAVCDSVGSSDDVNLRLSSWTQITTYPGGLSMSESDIVANQKMIIENQATILKNQEEIKKNQEALQLIIKNQEKILAAIRK